MTARAFLPLASLCALVAGCAASTELPAEPETAPPPRAAVANEPPKGWGLPVAPPPRAKKTTAELLVGKWELIELDGGKVTGFSMMFEFGVSGTFAIVTVIQRPGQEPDVRVGEYQLEGDKLTIAAPRMGKGASEIRTLDETHLETAYKIGANKFEVMKFKRILK